MAKGRAKLPHAKTNQVLQTSGKGWLAHKLLHRFDKLHDKSARSRLPKNVELDMSGRCEWLPSGWVQARKKTASNYTVFVGPQGQVQYNRVALEKYLGRELGPEDGFESQVQFIFQRAADQASSLPTKVGDADLFRCLSPAERKLLPDVDTLHFCVVSARRAQSAQGVRGIVGVEAQFLAAGVQPCWYVDGLSVQHYKRLGLDVVEGGKLTPSRNIALEDAARMGKACVQISDDVKELIFYVIDKQRARTFLPRQKHATREAAAAANLEAARRRMAFANRAKQRARELQVSPVAAARFLLAKMRATSIDGRRPYLAGPHPVCNAGFALAAAEFQHKHFILGDFFVADMSPCRFDTRLTLKEDYDFTCQHLKEHGAVLRCNRLLVRARHETNEGGACTIRDTAGEKELANIRILQRKWPGKFRANKKRGNQVLFTW
eukprot:TRINITY_DN43470_c0_g1_i1.p1 TRINITY_DN43470_c0_g1~~TRINITY_DN43470_c0_g1_i1.p1  ORF type:complete len:435 (-),score=53.90 TRINITY_DN43470_c0_g1_i1:163-1467(-)